MSDYLTFVYIFILSSFIADGGHILNLTHRNMWNFTLICISVALQSLWYRPVFIFLQNLSFIWALKFHHSKTILSKLQKSLLTANRTWTKSALTQITVFLTAQYLDSFIFGFVRRYKFRHVWIRCARNNWI